MNTDKKNPVFRFLSVFICVHLWFTPLLSAADPVLIGPPEKRSLVRTVEQPGHIEPFAQTPLLVRISGYVKSVQADIGDRVKAGQVLAELDVPELVEELNQKIALVAQAKSEITQAEKLLAVAEKNVQSAAAAVTEAMAARKRATANYERWKSETVARGSPRRPQDHRRADPRRDAESIPLGRGDARRSRGQSAPDRGGPGGE